jgi:hypothetical protein
VPIHVVSGAPKFRDTLEPFHDTGRTAAARGRDTHPVTDDDATTSHRSAVASVEGFAGLGLVLVGDDSDASAVDRHDSSRRLPAALVTGSSRRLGAPATDGDDIVVPRVLECFDVDA